MISARKYPRLFGIDTKLCRLLKSSDYTNKEMLTLLVGVITRIARENGFWKFTFLRIFSTSFRYSTKIHLARTELMWTHQDDREALADVLAERIEFGSVAYNRRVITFGL